jgi:hypothetical protein
MKAEIIAKGFGNAFFLNKGSWTFAEGIVLSVAYWALVLFGFQSYVTRRLFEGLMGYCTKNTDPEWHKSDVIKIAEENRLANWMVKRIWASNYQKEDRFKHMISMNM